MPARIYVRGPNWIGDVVMATPILASLRERFPESEIHLGLRAYAQDVLHPCPFVDKVHILPPSGLKGIWQTSRLLKSLSFDLAVLLANSFGAAAEVALAGIKRRRGYAIDGRGWLLNEPLKPRRTNRQLTPMAMTKFYYSLIQDLGCELHDLDYKLSISPEDETSARMWLQRHGLDANRPWIGVSPGASFGSSKLWQADRFAAVADQVIREFGAQVILLGGPKEIDLLNSVENQMVEPCISSANDLISLGPLKEIIRRLSCLVTTDSGPRAIAQAMKTPVVVLMGPTNPAWTDLNNEESVIIRHDVPCGPCHKKICDLDHRCMTQIETGQVFAAIQGLGIS